MAYPYSQSRPWHGYDAQVNQFEELEKYAYRPDVIKLLNRILVDILQDKPVDPLQYIVTWVQTETGRIQGQKRNPDKQETEFKKPSTLDRSETNKDRQQQSNDSQLLEQQQQQLREPQENSQQ